MFCYYCGKENKNGAAFCSHCGKPLRAAKVDTPPRPAAPGRPPKKKVSPPKKKKTGIVLGLLLALVLIGGVICTLIYFDVVDIPFVKDFAGVSEYENEPSDAEEEEDEPEMLTVPDVVSETRENAMERLRDAGFQELVVEEVYDENVPVGYVISTSFDAGEEITDETTVVVYVSLGTEPFDLPDVAGSDELSAIEALETLGMFVEVIYDNSDEIPAGCVMSQNPAAGTTQIKGTTVTIYVSMGKEESSVSQAGDYWVDTGRISYYVPAGFGTIQNGNAGSTVWQELYNPELDMTIIISGCTTDDLGWGPLDQLENDVDNFDTSTRSVTYESDDTDWFVRSGYLNDTGDIYYFKELVSEGSPDMLICMSFTYPTETQSQCDSVLITFLENLKE